jgi:hypothetical protein
VTAVDAMALAEAVKHGFRGLDASMLGVAAELSIDPVWTGWPAALEVDGQALIAWPAEDDEVSILRGCYTFAV